MKKLLQRWYHGKTEMLEFDNEPGSGVIIFPTFITTYHWTARLARRAVKFYVAHWQFLWGTAIGLASLWVGILSLK
jgi:hypothetical protein